MLNIPTRTSIPATADQLAALKAELAKPDYQGLSDAQVANRINRGASEPNPTPQPLVFKPSVTRDYFFSALFPVFQQMQTKDADDPVRLMIEGIIKYVNSNRLNTIALTSGNIAVLNSLVSDGVVTQDSLDADFKEPDKTWKATVQTIAPMAGTLYPAERVQVEAADVTAARVS